MKEEKLINLRIQLREETYHFLENVIKKLGSHIDLEKIKKHDLNRMIAWLKVLEESDFPKGKEATIQKLESVRDGG